MRFCASDTLPYYDKAPHRECVALGFFAGWLQKDEKGDYEVVP
jgi:hypothetical protein